MRRKFFLTLFFFLVLVGVAAIAAIQPANAGENLETFLPTIFNPENTPIPTATSVPPTTVPPTATAVPPTPTPIPWEGCSIRQASASEWEERGNPLPPNTTRVEVQLRRGGQYTTASWTMLRVGGLVKTGASYVEVELSTPPWVEGAIVEVYGDVVPAPLYYCGTDRLVLQ